jgi:hypothetical protein
MFLSSRPALYLLLLALLGIAKAAPLTVPDDLAADGRLHLNKCPNDILRPLQPPKLVTPGHSQL